MASLRGGFAKVIRLLNSKMAEMEQLINTEFDKLIAGVQMQANRVIAKQQLIDRNYSVLELAL